MIVQLMSFIKSLRKYNNHTCTAEHFYPVLSSGTGRLLCVSNVLVHRTTCTSVSLRWEEPARGLSYRVGLCQTGLVDCSFHYTYSCSDCSSYQVTGLLPNRNYTFTVDSFVSSTSEECSSQSCSSNTVTATTEVLCEFSAMRCCCIYQYSYWMVEYIILEDCKFSDLDRSL